MRVTILYGNNIFEATEQIKTFATMEMAIAWCKRNYAKIHKINDLMTFGEMPNYFDMIGALEKR